MTRTSAKNIFGKKGVFCKSFDGKIICYLLRNNLLILGILIGVVSQLQSQSKSDRIRDFTQNTGAIITYNEALGNPEFIRFAPDGPGLDLDMGTSEQKTSAFLSNHAYLLGIKDQPGELNLQNQVIDRLGHEHLTYQQFYHGIPVFGGKVKFHYGQSGYLRAINGVFVPDIKINPQPAITFEEAREVALAHIGRQFPRLSHPLQATEGNLYIFRKGLLQNLPGGNHLVFEILVENIQEVREFVYVDAHTAMIVDQFTGMHGILSRKLYEESISNNIWSEGDAFPDTLDIWQQNEIEAAGHTYYFFKHAFGFDSYDGNGAIMKTINNNPGISCPNANWNGSTTNYCDGTASDDVVAHEWGHAYTDYTSDLIYAWQSGALNESYSDIWGETIDLLNNYEDTGEDLSLRNACASSQRWRLGEDASAFGSALRDMWDPTCKGDPGKVSDPQYHCSSSDNGGVHSNSGVPNHAYVLLVDGGTYNGQTTTGIGFTKAAHIFWHAQSTYLTSTSDFGVMADALEASCSDLMGQNLEGLSTTATAAGPSGEIINANDLLQLQKVLLAVEMRMDPNCPFSPILGDAPPLCLAAIPDSAIFYEDFESGLGNWAVSQVPENPETWENREWSLTTSLPDLRPGTAAFGPDPIIGDCGLDLENGIISLLSPSIVIPTGTPGIVELAFEHYLSTENLWDGAHLMYKINEGSWLQVPSESFVINGYNATLNTAGQGNDNPMAGKEAFTGSDGGSVAGSWGRSVVDLSSIGILPEDSIRLSWDVSTDGCNGRIGWYVDNVAVYACGPCTDTITLAQRLSNHEIMFQAFQQVRTTDTISDDARITYSATSEIVLDGGFELEYGSEMTIIMDGCQVPGIASAKIPLTTESLLPIRNQELHGELDLGLFGENPQEDSVIRIYDSHGKQVQSAILKESPQERAQSWSIDISDLPKGIYNAQVITNQKNSTLSFWIR